MKFHPLFPTILAIMLLTAACQSMLDSTPRIDLWGDPAPTSAATRTIVIASGTKYVNVTDGEIIQFIAGGKAFAWNFDSLLDVPAFDLKLIAPPGALDHQVLVYVAPSLRHERERLRSF